MSAAEIEPITTPTVPDHVDTRPLFEPRMAAVAADAATRVITKPIRKSDVIDVRFDGTNWCIEDATLVKALQFARLADAQARANDLSKVTGHTVCVHGQDGELLA